MCVYLSSYKSEERRSHGEKGGTVGCRIAEGGKIAKKGGKLIKIAPKNGYYPKLDLKYT